VGAVILLAVHRREGRRRSQFAKSLIRASALATVSLLLSPRPAAAQTVPTPESVFGHNPGATAVVVCGANDAPYPTRRGAGVSPAMPVFLPAFPEQRRHGRRRGNLKGRSTEWIRRISCAALPYLLTHLPTASHL
jgi:hypothetical protein